MTQLATIDHAPIAPPANLALVQKQNERFVILDKYATNGVAAIESRVNAIATISGGFRGDNNRPNRSSDGTIFLHGDAPGLAEVLQSRGGKSLTVMYPSDRIADFVQQRFTEYSATELKAYGDEQEIITIDRGQRQTHKVGTDGYRAALSRCKVAVSVYFNLAEWSSDGRDCDMIFPDGFGLYRLRFTSMNSLRSILSSAQHMARLTNGRIAAIPFELFLREEEHSDPTGAKRRVWIWQSLPKAPAGVRLTANGFRSIMESGQQQRAMFQLDAPRVETLESAVSDTPLLDLDEISEGEIDNNIDEAQLETAQRGGICDAEHWRAMYFAIVKDTPLDSDRVRRELVLGWTDERISSLAKFLAEATESDAREFIDYVRQVLDARLRDDYELLVRQGEEFGLKRVELPTDANVPKIMAYIASVQKAIARKKEAAPAPTATPEVTQSAPPQSTVKNATPLDHKIHEKAVEAATVSDEEKAEIEHFFGDAATPDAETSESTEPNSIAPDSLTAIAATDAQAADARPANIDADGVVDGEVVGESATPPLPIPVQNLMMAAASAKLDTTNFLENPTVLEAINAFLATKKRPPIERVLDITPSNSVQCLAAVHNGSLKW